jgi:hypothetical protein
MVRTMRAIVISDLFEYGLNECILPLHEVLSTLSPNHFMSASRSGCRYDAFPVTHGERGDLSLPSTNSHGRKEGRWVPYTLYRIVRNLMRSSRSYATEED